MRRKHLFYSLLVVSYICLSVCCCFSFTSSKNYNYDYLAYRINDYNRNIDNDDFQNPILTIRKNEDSIKKTGPFFDDLYEEFYYNFLVSSIREKISNSSLKVDDSEISLYTQSTFSIRKQEEPSGGYYVDYGLFYAYFSDNILGNRGYLKIRNDCDSFVFISDKFADKLLEKYGLSSYEELILSDEYSILPVTLDNGQVLKFSINNILYSSKRTAPRCSELYGSDFGLIYFKKDFLTNNLRISFEMDLDSSAFNMRNNFNTLESYGYNNSNSDFSFRIYDKQLDKYLESDYANTYFKEIITTNYSEWISITTLLISVIAFIALLFLYSARWVELYSLRPILLILPCFIVFFVWSIVTTFAYSYPLFMVFPIIAFLAMLITFGKEVRNELSSFFVFGRNDKYSRQSFASLEI